MRSSRRMLWGAVPLLCVVAACGGSSDKSSGPDAVATTGSTPGKTPGKTAAGKAADPCKVVTPAEIEAIVGHPIEVESDPNGGCQFGDPDDPRLVSVGLGAGVPDATGGGIESSKSGSTGVIKGDAQDLDGVGDAAYIVVGPFSGSMGGKSINAQSGLVVKGYLFNVTMTQSGPTDGVPEMTKYITAVTKLVADKV